MANQCNRPSPEAEARKSAKIVAQKAMELAVIALCGPGSIKNPMPATAEDILAMARVLHDGICELEGRFIARETKSSVL